jgi:transcriptional regulator with XRE-family HTH domain
MRDIASLDDYRAPRPATEHADHAPRREPEGPSEPEPLWREALGARLREARREQGATLARIAARAGVSPQYLSEMERGVKEPSSEMIAAVAGALGTSLPDLVGDVARSLSRHRPATPASRPSERRRPSDHLPELLAA